MVQKHQELIYELVLLKRMLYKCKNQHRRTLYYKKLQLVSRTLQRFRTHIDSEITDRERVELLEFGLKAIENAYLVCKGEASQSYFMAVNMMFMAILSRLFVLAKDILKGLNFVEVGTVNTAIRAMEIRPEEDERDQETTKEFKEMISKQQNSLSDQLFMDSASFGVNTSEPVAIPSRTSKSKKSKKKSKATDEIDDLFASFY